ncbi:MAG: translation initiation factor IF-2 subunit beta [Nitrososphaerales archaeon]
MTLPSYEELLKRLRKGLEERGIKIQKGQRLTLPEPQVLWIGNKTILRNFSDYPKLLRRDPNRVLIFLAKELATAASLDGERAIFIGRKDKQSFTVLLNRYMQEGVLCPVCGSPDTKSEKVKRLQLLVCEACGAKSSVKVM